MEKELLKMIGATVMFEFVCVLVFALQDVINANRNTLVALLVIALLTMVVIVIARKVINDAKVAYKKLN